MPVWPTLLAHELSCRGSEEGGWPGPRICALLQYGHNSCKQVRRGGLVQGYVQCALPGPRICALLGHKNSDKLSCQGNGPRICNLLHGYKGQG